MKNPLIACPECRGTGTAPLSDMLTETLDALGRKGMHAAELQIHGVTKNAINNRLEALREMGFVERHRCGKFWIYRRVKKGGAQ